MLLLDSEALSAIAHGPAARRDRVRALIVAMQKRGRPVATVSAVLTELVRGRSADAAVFSGVRRERLDVHPVDEPVAIRAGQLLGAVGEGSELAIDAFIVALGDLLGGAVIATVDGRDLNALADHAPGVVVSDIC